MKTKPILLSKTFWLNFLALLLLAWPAGRSWVESNPVEPLAALTGLNMLVRFFTGDKVSLWPVDDDSADKHVSGIDGPPAVLGLLAAGSLAGVFGFPLSGCTPAQLEAARAVPVRACYIDRDGNSVCYSPTDGVTATVDRRGAK